MIAAWAIAASTARAADPGDEVRLAVVIGSNHGLPGEVALAYAGSDAERVGGLLRTLGGYGAGDVWVLSDATVDALYAALARVTVRAQEASSAGGRVSLLLFYAGHASNDGLHLAGDVLPLPDLKAAIRVVPAADRIVVLDACQAGAIARSRGATLVDVRDAPLAFQPPTDEAWLMSSGPEERSFEVEDRRGALFTHFFLSGARGAADADGDSAVTLGELYGFVQAQTQAAAADLGQLQQPRWAGTLGGFRLTDLASSASGVRVVGPIAQALLIVDESSQQVVAEVPRGAGTSLALPEGQYQVVATTDRGVAFGRMRIPADGWTLWQPAHELGNIAGVRTRGGLIDPTPWALQADYRLGVGTIPGRTDAHGVYLGLERELGRGHAVELGVSAGWMPFATDWWQGSDTSVELRGGWTREVFGARIGRHGTATFAPGLAVGAGVAAHRGERAPHRVWGAWYGADLDAGGRMRPIGSAELGADLALPIGPVSADLWLAGVLVAGRSEQIGLTPGAVGRLGLAVPFR